MSETLEKKVYYLGLWTQEAVDLLAHLKKTGYNGDQVIERLEAFIEDNNA